MTQHHDSFENEINPHSLFEHPIGRREFLRLSAGGVAVASGLSALSSVTALSKAEAAAAKKGGTIVLGWEADPDVLAPVAATAGNTIRAMYYLYEPLISEDVTVKAPTIPPLVPGLAKSWTISSDGIVYTFNLRENVKFHDGTPFNAEAVKFNFDSGMDEKHPYYSAGKRAVLGALLRWIDRVEMVDAMTIRIILKEPIGDMERLLAGLTIGMISPSAIKKYGVEKIGLNPVGTGPYRFVEREIGQKIVLEKNKDYWGPQPLIDRIIIRPIVEAAARDAALEAGEIDFNVVVSPDSIARFQRNPNITVQLGGPPHIWMWMMNNRDTPTKDKRVRQALNWGINREALVRDILKGSAEPAKGPIPPGHPAYTPELYPGYGYDPAKAKALLSEAGYPNGVRLKALIPASGSGMMVPIAINEFLQANVKQVGVDVEFEVVEWATFLATSRKGMTPDHSIHNSSWSTNTFYWIEQMWHTKQQPPGGNNRGWHSDPKIDELLDKGRVEVSEEKRLGYYREAGKLLWENAPWVFVVHDLLPRAHASRLKGWVAPASWYIDLSKAYFEA